MILGVDESKQVAPRQETALMSSDNFIATVLSQPDSAEKVQLLRELIAMQNAERERQNKEQFDLHFAELRRALQPVVKTRVNSGTNSKFAALEDLSAILVKQDKKVVKAAMSQLVKPVPRTFFAPK